MHSCNIIPKWNDYFEMSCLNKCLFCKICLKNSLKIITKEDLSKNYICPNCQEKDSTINEPIDMNKKLSTLKIYW